MRNPFKKKLQLTKLPNGKKPSYADLECSLTRYYQEIRKLNEDLKRMADDNAYLRYRLAKMEEELEESN